MTMTRLLYTCVNVFNRKQKKTNVSSSSRTCLSEPESYSS